MTEEEILDQAAEKEVDSILKELIEFYTPQDAVTWMFGPQKRWGDLSAYRLVREGRGDEVRAVVDQLKSGAYL